MSRAASGEPPPDLPSGYEGLRVGFTAAVSHELRTPLARLLSLLDTAKLPGADVDELIDEACAEVVEMTQLVDDILFLSELEQGREVVALGFTELAPHVHELYGDSRERALRAELALEADVPAGLVVPLRPRMLQVVLGNLLDNALRYAGRGATFRIAARQEGEHGRCSRSPTTARAWMPSDVAAPVRALLPLRSLAHDARHGPRARDRQAHHHRGRRHRRGGGRAGRGHALSLRPARAAQRAHPLRVSGVHAAGG